MRYILIIMTILAAPASAGDWAITGTVALIDGDSLCFGEVRIGSRGGRSCHGGPEIRLAGPDAFEGRQTCVNEAGGAYPCGEVAREALAALVGAAPVTCAGTGEKSFDRYVAVCLNAAGQDLAAELVRQGWALAHPRYGAAYRDEEAEAIAAGAGAHAGSFVTPWDWRRAH